MEHQVLDQRRHILPSNYTSPQISLDDPGFRQRRPLAEAIGNGQHQQLASVNSSEHDNKGYQPQGRPMYHQPILHSQPHRSVIADATHVLRGYSLKRHKRQEKFSRNPIADVPAFKLYRERQTREGCKKEDQKWPDILELAFLDGNGNLSFLTKADRPSSVGSSTYASSEVLVQKQATWSERNDSGVSLDRLLSKLTQRCYSGPTDEEKEETSLQPHSSPQKLLEEELRRRCCCSL